jgi:hypothetical protein
LDARLKEAIERGFPEGPDEQTTHGAGEHPPDRVSERLRHGLEQLTKKVVRSFWITTAAGMILRVPGVSVRASVVAGRSSTTAAAPRSQPA